ncbi:lipid-binding SYLF domain-containing protein [Dyadobacter sp. BE32]|uniref:Lipid-binding SYLF domain-containing protein n=2 Tax=Spirosomataceae TaxID=2896860 RepID=A0ABU1QYS1_9BACT|nr:MULTISPECIES: lipid-binding SYLF domain-containing protein [unclassified Dyadobacter]MDR6806309.1 lipid-binding SYLF domain-containing protein [Dyadobacter fermentans]MDR7044050.1 lipid-binding SYLF domain-containing protein [Dyadobacter sp. BE242]MDR7216323.1 lipid-binding SYLF domain-containing protein [Dyadobacter sp. BE31]MDR7264151.1 lipid-binding SYLF domain-containing protein [Dyadobacter sp. BE32]
MFLNNLKTMKTQALLLMSLAITAPSFAQNKEEERINAATAVLSDFNGIQIPAQLIEASKGIIIIPRMINGGLIVGGKHGKGLAMVKREDGEWSDPVFVTITGGSVGAQIGVQAVDLVLVFKSDKTLMNIEKGDYTLGGDVSVAAGPVSKNASATTDYKLEAEVYSYSRAKGLFAGVTVNGAMLDVDVRANTGLYGSKATVQSIFTDSNISSKAIDDLREKLDDFN